MVILILRQTIKDCTDAMVENHHPRCPMCGSELTDVTYRNNGSVMFRHFKSPHTCQAQSCQVLSARGHVRTAGFIPCNSDGTLLHTDDLGKNKKRTTRKSVPEADDDFEF